MQPGSKFWSADLEIVSGPERAGTAAMEFRKYQKQALDRVIPRAKAVGEHCYSDTLIGKETNHRGREVTQTTT